MRARTKQYIAQRKKEQEEAAKKNPKSAQQKRAEFYADLDIKLKKR